MVGKIGHIKVIELFLEYPTRMFQIRGIAKELKLPKTTVASYVAKMIKSGLIIKENKGVFPNFRANESSEKYKFFKTQYMLEKIMNSGLVEDIEDIFHPRSIVLFGSIAKGEYDKLSEVDLFVETEEIKFDLSVYEKKIGHPVNIYFDSNINNISSELFNNIINGIKLKGFLKIK